MFWTIASYLAVFLLGLLLGFGVGAASGEKGFIDKNYIGIFDVPSATLYYEKDVTSNSLSNENASYGVIDLVYLTDDRKARKDI